MKEFIFLYPIPEIINFEINRGSYCYPCLRKLEFKVKFERTNSEEEKELVKQKFLKVLNKEFRKFYKSNINSCIDLRYRQKGFGINYIVFDGNPVSDVIEIQQFDKVIEVGLDFKTCTTKQPNGEYSYPDQDYILNQLNGTRIIRITGFHMWDCVEKLAKRAYEKGLDTLVDEDLTELFVGRLRNKDFRVDKYPTYNPRLHGNKMFEMFMKARKDKPWLWQEY